MWIIMKTVIERVLTGDMEMDMFVKQLRNDQSLQMYICSLVPDEAKGDPAHSFWKNIPYESMRKNNFDYFQYLFWAQNNYNKFAHHLNIFSRLQRAYLYYDPNVSCTSRYKDAFAVYLDVIQDCFDGLEVRCVVEAIIEESLQLKLRSQRKKYAQSAIKEQFHLENKKRPRWVQGPEWPMGKGSPMAFISQKRFGELVQFTFRDVDTEEIKKVIQFY